MDSRKLREKYINKVPILLISKDIVLTKKKFLVDSSYTLSELLVVIRKYVQDLKPSDALFLYTHNNTILQGNIPISYIDENYKDKDGFVYITCQKEETFGTPY